MKTRKQPIGKSFQLLGNIQDKAAYNGEKDSRTNVLIALDAYIKKKKKDDKFRSAVPGT